MANGTGKTNKKGVIKRIYGPVVEGKDIPNANLYDVVKVGNQGLMGEIIKIVGDTSVIQVYEDTSALQPGESVENTGEPMSVELGPGILTNIYDGIQRPLRLIEEKGKSVFIQRGIFVPPLDRKKKWDFKATAKKGGKVKIGDVLGTVQETELIVHKILSPYDGKLEGVTSGKFTVEDELGYVVASDGKKKPLFLAHKWPVRKPRACIEKFPPIIPLITGQRVIDTFFPIAKGGTACIPGPFGSGKTVTQQSLAKYSDTEIVVYIGCGERGNEMTEVLKEFPHLIDPKTGKPLMERTVLIANTSNMPVAAREASVYTGVTIAEYFRDMGYNVALMADSTSRWAEAMREIGGRLEEMPGEEGYPAYLARRLAEFYERAGRVRCLGSDERYGSVTIIGAVSPPGGDLSEPVSQNTLRVTKVFLALDASLAYRRHFPAINWLKSYSLYQDSLEEFYAENISSDFTKLRAQAMALLQKEAELNEIVQLVGPDALPEREQAVLLVTRMLREDYLQQNAYSDIDARCSLQKQYAMLKTVLRFYERTLGALDLGAQLKRIVDLPSRVKIGRMKEITEEKLEEFEKLQKDVDEDFDSVSKK
ncbi:TPA: V-type ATP synthase subunit A [Candidatus Micrarchaeota archaeon]|nr:V-type ATP synthase subunit A [Candidatus Micrarchaeota archaeon]